MQTWIDYINSEERANAERYGEDTGEEEAPTPDIHREPNFFMTYAEGVILHGCVDVCLKKAREDLKDLQTPKGDGVETVKVTPISKIRSTQNRLRHLKRLKANLDKFLEEV